uniref:NLR family, pyrin domain containing 5 n=1 Tax=Cricetulus griseus TaxID=10029 RepID=A0A8C2LDX2_CRIGR
RSLFLSVAEDSRTHQEEDREPIPSDQGPDEGQAPGLHAGLGCDLQTYKAHMITKLSTSLEICYDHPEMRVLSEAFKPDQNTFRPHTVVLHGKPGIGKSALARSVILGWAQDKLYQDISYAFFFSPREMQWAEKSSLAQLISREWADSQAPMTEIMSQPERLLFVVDDFDDLDSALPQEDTRLCEDWKDEQPIHTLLYSLLKKTLLPQSFLLVTTRDTGLQKLKSMVVSPLYILVEGLSATKRTQLVLENVSDDHRRKQVIRSMLDNQWLAEQCRVPSICSLVCKALKIQEKLGGSCTPVCQTLTSLYSTLVFHQLTPREPFRGCLSPEERGTLMGLCRMAAEGVWSKRSVFYDNDLKTYGLKESEISALFGMDVFQASHSAKRCYAFFHLSLQDFFAALHYVLEGLGTWNQSCFVIKNLRSLSELKGTHFNAHLGGMKRFLFGLVNKDTMRTLEVLLGYPLSPVVNQVLQHWVFMLGQQANDTSPMDVLDAFRHVFESQDKDFVCSALKSFREVEIQVNQRTDLVVSSYCLQHCKNLEALRVDVSDIFSVEMNTELLWPDLHLKPISKCCMTQGKPLIMECWEDFCSILGTHPKLKQLDLGSSILSEWAMKIMCLKLKNQACKVQSLTFKNAEVVSGLRHLWMTLVSNRNLKYLHLGNTLMEENDIKLACQALQHPKCSLETLRLDSCALTPDCYLMLSNLLLSTTSLRCLSLAGNKVTEKSMRWLCDALNSSKCALQKLILDSCELMPVSCHILASALCGNRTLTHLCLSDNSLRTEEVRRLCRFMSNPECALQRLILKQCNLRGDAYGFLALMLSHNGKLTHLNLTMNPVEDGGMKLLCDAIKKPTLDRDLASVITRNQHLKSLDLSSNALGDSGVIALCKALKQNNSSLRRLGLEACGLTSDCCTELSLALSCNSRLTSLNLMKNDFSTPGMLKLCSAFLHPTSNLWIIGLWKQQYYAKVRRQLEKVQFIKPHMVIDGDWYAFDEDDRNWWKN